MLRQGQTLKGFVGRTKESKQLGRLFDECLEHGARMVLISGETGIGKTSLLEQLRGNALARGGYYLVCKSGLLGSPFPYHPLAELLRVLLGELGQSHVKEVVARYSPRVLAELSLLVPKYGTLISTHRGYETTGNLPDKLFLENACSIGRDLLRDKPVVLIMEDIPYADPTSIEVLQYLLQHQEDFPILICATYDLDDIDLASSKFTPFRNFIRALNYDRALTKINLGSFTREESEKFMGYLLGERILSAELVDTVFVKGEGNPLVIKHLIEKLIQTKNLQKTAKGWEFTRPLEVALPQEILEMFLIRLEGIRPELRGVLSTAAVIGHKFTGQTLAQLMDTPLADLLPFLEEALHLNLIEEHYDLVHNYFTFVSSRLQEVLYENLSYQRKMLLHQQVGLLLEQTRDFRTEPDEFAYHFQWGTDKVKAVKYSILAGQRAISLCAFHSAWRNFCNARDLFPLLDEQAIAEFKYPVLEGLAESACFLGYYAEARTCLGELLGCGAPEDNQAYGSVHFKLGDLCLRMGNFSETLEHYFLALQHGDNSHKAVITNRLIHAYLEMGNFEEAASLAHLQLERALQSGGQTELVDIYCLLALLYIYSGEVNKSVEYADKIKMFQVANELGEIQVNIVLGQLALEIGPLSWAKEQFQAGLNLARKVQDPLLMGKVETLLARALILEGNGNEAQEALDRVKSLHVYSHSFVLQVIVNRQEILAQTLGQLSFDRVLRELEEVWNGKTHNVFGAAIMAKRAEMLALSDSEQATCIAALEEARSLQMSFSTPRNQIYLLRAEAAYQFKFGSRNQGIDLLWQILNLCEQQGLNSEGLITSVLWHEQLERKVTDFENKLGMALRSIKTHEPVAVKQQGYIPEEVGMVLNYIHNQYNTDISIAALCRIATLSERQLRRLFSQHIGSSIKEYINNYRITRAQELLLNPTLGVNQVGQLVGISDKTNFCRTFKAVVGVSPSEYRKSQQASVRKGQQIPVNQL